MNKVSITVRLARGCQRKCISGNAARKISHNCHSKYNVQVI